MDTRRVPVDDGVVLAVDEWAGEGVPVLLVHGLASNARLWDGVACALTRAGHRVAAVDQRGHGRSDRPATGYDFATVCHDLLGVIAALGLERPVVAGQSWGGNVALELAIRHPEATRGIVLIDGGWIELSSRFPTWEQCAEVLAPPTMDGLRYDELAARVRGWHPTWPEPGVAGTMASYERLPDGGVRALLPRDRHMAILRELWAHRPTERYAAVDVPVLLVPAGDGTAAGAAAAALRRAHVVAFPGAHHDVHAEHPDDVAGAIHTAIADGFLA